jgi:hypothetical protein
VNSNKKNNEIEGMNDGKSLLVDDNGDSFFNPTLQPNKSA